MWRVGNAQSTWYKLCAGYSYNCNLLYGVDGGYNAEDEDERQSGENIR